MEISKNTATSPLVHASALTCSQWWIGEEKGPLGVKGWRWTQENLIGQFLGLFEEGVMHWSSSPPKATLWGCSLQPSAEIAPLLAWPLLPPPSTSVSVQWTSCLSHLKSKPTALKACVIQLCLLSNTLTSYVPDSAPALLVLVLCFKYAKTFPSIQCLHWFLLCLECSSPRSAHSWLHSPFGFLSNKESFLMTLSKVTYPMPFDPHPSTTAHHCLSKHHTHLLLFALNSSQISWFTCCFV